jgi:transcriptional regulator with XRE-family HTH domain
MDSVRVGLGFRALRRRHSWTQANLGARARVSRSVICRIERGHADRVAVHTLVRVAAALDARIDVRLLWQGEGLDRLLDVDHAQLVDHVLGLLTSSEWSVATEVTFNIRGERGSVDILAFHPATGSLLVIEIKSVVPDMQSMLVALDRKGRLAREIAMERGWNVTSVTRLLVLPDNRTARRRVEDHAATFDTALPARTVQVRTWLKRPEGTLHGVMFVSDVRQPGTRQRVRVRPASRRAGVSVDRESTRTPPRQMRA